ncbi:tRNA (guanosine(37)-N1)-methyltransferase TrmD [Candidatus Nomurabacteria bacterium]|nr:tRNA (guanosine(37)-N1)-methyltransferase TrmD [Candidatus Nomurabacteria bacterium]USN94825.1 MAG: tRNA (guanosine(37)-N1)-methyltransferase TrmD [Candidatus Nomurabacteria bacterium]
MHFHVVTLFPESFDSYLKESIIGRAIKQKKIKVTFYNPRKFVSGKYKRVWPDGNVSLIVDGKPFGGGPGMILRAEPVIKAIEKALNKINSASPRLRRTPKVKIINFAPSGKKFSTTYAKTTSKKYTDIILICGRYEGIDARINKVFKTEKISIGDYVLTGGELPAMVVIDSMARQIPGVLGNHDSLEEERVSSSEFYTRPEVLTWFSKYKVDNSGKIIENKQRSKSSSRRSTNHAKQGLDKKYKVPKVLLSGDHKKIEEWKKGKK